jgi:hypothetical protein
MSKIHLQVGFKNKKYKAKKTLCGRSVKQVDSTKDVGLVTCSMCRGLKSYIWRK